jgi:hypothetical protein
VARWSFTWIEVEASALAVSKIDLHFIHVAPSPCLSGLEGLHDGMARLVKVFRGMAVLRRVTATHMAASLAESQVNPGVAQLQALLATAGVGFDLLNLIQMPACWFHSSLLTFPFVKMTLSKVEGSRAGRRLD